MQATTRHHLLLLSLLCIFSFAASTFVLFDSNTTLCENYSSPCNLSDPLIWINNPIISSNDSLHIISSKPVYIVVPDTVYIRLLVVDVLEGYLLIDGGQLHVDGKIVNDIDVQISVNLTLQNNALLNIANGFVFLAQNLGIHDTSALSALFFSDAFNGDDVITQYVASTIVLTGTAALRTSNINKIAQNFTLRDSSSIALPSNAQPQLSEYLLNNIAVLDNSSISTHGGTVRLVFNETALYSSTVIPDWPYISLIPRSSLNVQTGLHTWEITIPNSVLTVHGDFQSRYGVVSDAQPWGAINLQNSNAQLAYGVDETVQEWSTTLQGVHFNFQSSIVTIGNLSNSYVVPTDVSSIILRNSTLTANALLSNIDTDDTSVLVSNILHITGNVTSNGQLVVPDEKQFYVTNSGVYFKNCVWGHAYINISTGDLTCAGFAYFPQNFHHDVVEKVVITNGKFTSLSTSPISIHSLVIEGQVIISAEASINVSITESLTLTTPTTHLSVLGDLHFTNSTVVLPTLSDAVSEFLYVDGTLFLTEGISLSLFYNSADLPHGAAKYVVVRTTLGIVGKFSSVSTVTASSYQISVEYSENEIALVFVEGTTKAPLLVWWAWVLIGVGGAIFIAGVGFIGYRLWGRRTKYQPVG